MENYSSFAMAIAMVAAFLLIAGGVKLVLDRQTRVRGVLMIVAAVVLITNVMIWTV
jgi:high-affinity Fe2+/Pb2+ permease